MDNLDSIELSSELKQVLWACYNYWSKISSPPDERNICYSWLAREYTEKFGKSFHQSRLTMLANQGILKRTSQTRGGSRQYTLANPEEVQNNLQKWNLL